MDLGGFESSWDDFVSFYIGCSFSFETELLESEVYLANTRQGKVVSIYTSNISLEPVGPFEGKMVLSMRMIDKSQLVKAFEISSRYPDHHGAPVHIGDPSRVGISDIMKPDRGDPPVEIRSEDVPMFWACGVTGREAIFSASKSSNIIRIVSRDYIIIYACMPIIGHNCAATRSTFELLFVPCPQLATTSFVSMCICGE